MDHTRRFMIGMAGLIMIAVSGCDLRPPGAVSQSLSGTPRRVILLIDASGSMTLPRKDDLVDPTRFDKAKSVTQDDIVQFSSSTMFPLVGMRVFIFQDIGITEQIPPNPDPVTHLDPDPDHDGWFAADNVSRTIGRLSGPSLSTPLAGSLCDAADVFTATKLPPDDVKMLATYSDGGENSTNAANPCYSLDTATWQHSVEVHVQNDGVQFNGTLFTDVTGLAPPATPSRQAADVTRLEGAAPALSSGLTDAEFFAELARLTGGTFRRIRDDQRGPVFADITGDLAVDRADAILLARQFGRPADPRFDLNGDGVIDFKDYLIVLSRLGVGGGQPDPYAPRDPVVCQDNNEIVIDGQVIENAGITITTRGSCKGVTIRNSLIVSGQNAITIVGATQVTVDNSIVVGQDAAITLRGVARLSTLNSILHGRTDVHGQIKLTDLGGNVFE